MEEIVSKHVRLPLELAQRIERLERQWPTRISLNSLMILLLDGELTRRERGLK